MVRPPGLEVLSLEPEHDLPGDAEPLAIVEAWCPCPRRNHDVTGSDIAVSAAHDRAPLGPAKAGDCRTEAEIGAPVVGEVKLGGDGLAGHNGPGRWLAADDLVIAHEEVREAGPGLGGTELLEVEVSPGGDGSSVVDKASPAFVARCSGGGDDQPAVVVKQHRTGCRANLAPDLVRTLRERHVMGALADGQPGHPRLGVRRTEIVGRVIAIEPDNIEAERGGLVGDSGTERAEADDGEIGGPRS